MSLSGIIIDKRVPLEVWPSTEGWLVGRLPLGCCEDLKGIEDIFPSTGRICGYHTLKGSYNHILCISSVRIILQQLFSLLIHFLIYFIVRKFFLRNPMHS